MLHGNLILIEKDYYTKNNVMVGKIAVGSTEYQ